MKQQIYDQTQDVTLRVIGEVKLDSKASLRVSIKQYKNGLAKTDIIKFGKRENGTEWTSIKIGRLTSGVCRAIGDMLLEADRYLYTFNETPPRTVTSSRNR